MEYKDLSAKDLQWAVVEGYIDPALFSVVSSFSMNLGNNVAVEARIIGSSHWVTISVAGQEFHEVFACDIGSPNGNFTVGPIQGNNLEQQIYSKSVGSYRFISEEKPYVLAQGLVHTMRAQIQGTWPTEFSKGVIFQFPSIENQTFPPETIFLAHYETDPNILHFQSAHLYPNESNVVVTKSQIYLEALVEQAA